MRVQTYTVCCTFLHWQVRGMETNAECYPTSQNITFFRKEHTTEKCNIKVWWQYATLFVYFSYFITYIQSSNHIHTIHSPRPLSISSSLVSSVGQTSLWCRAENQTRACLPASRRATNSNIRYIENTIFSWCDRLFVIL
jgi:hypothetical protein